MLVKVVIENNYLSSITLNNASELVISDNRGNSSNGHAGRFRIDTCKNITISNNRLEIIGLRCDTIMSITGNDLSCSGKLFLGRLRGESLVFSSD